jgi:hypothetical protein
MYCMYDTCILGGNLLPYIFTLLSWEAVARKFPHGLHWYAYLNSRYITLNLCILVCIYLSMYVCMYKYASVCMGSCSNLGRHHILGVIFEYLDGIIQIHLILFFNYSGRSVHVCLCMYVCMYAINIQIMHPFIAYDR